MPKSIEDRRPRAGSRAIFAEWLVGVRGFRSVRQVVETAGQSKDWYIRIESGARITIGRKELRILAKALGVEPQEVFKKAGEAGY